VKYLLASFAAICFFAAAFDLSPDWQERWAVSLSGTVALTGFVICGYIDRLAKR
jgi:hypothetical protein